jgi:hypothetical protein
MNRKGLVAVFGSPAGSGRLRTEDSGETMDGSSDRTLAHAKVDVLVLKAMMR